MHTKFKGRKIIELSEDPKENIFICLVGTKCHTQYHLVRASRWSTTELLSSPRSSHFLTYWRNISYPVYNKQTEGNKQQNKTFKENTDKFSNINIYKDTISKLKLVAKLGERTI